METFFQAFLILVSALLITVVLMQSRGAGFGGAFGTQGGGAYRTRRGLERYLFRGTVVLAAVFVCVALVTARMHIPS